MRLGRDNEMKLGRDNERRRSGGGLTEPIRRGSRRRRGAATRRRLALVALLACACAAPSPEDHPTGSAGTSSGVDGSAGRPDRGPSCARALWEPEPVPLDLVLLLNRSTGMGGPAWRPHLRLLREALLRFTDTAPLRELSVGLQVFPSLEGERCLASSYRSLLVPLETIPAASDGLKIGLLEAEEFRNFGQTGSVPLRPALLGTFQFLQARLADQPGRQAAVVIVTNGAGYDCGSSWDLEDITQLVAQSRRGDPSIATFVVGLEGSEVLERNRPIAEAGGSGDVTFIGEEASVEELARALEGVRRRASSCEFELPRPPGVRIDPRSVRVQFTPNDEPPLALALLESEADCSGGKEGFYYEDPASPERLVLCPVSCAIARAEETDIRLDIGCVEVVR